MKSIFLSASVPVQGRGNFFDTANPFLIQFAVRELLTVCLGRRHIVWGGHPAITPMVWAVCEDIGVEYSNAVTLFQSKYFEGNYPLENVFFKDAIYVDSIHDSLDASIEKMRLEMLNKDYEAAVFIGGMEGIFAEHELFTRFHPEATVLAVGSPGGASRQLADKLHESNERIDFARLYFEALGVDSLQERGRV